MKAVFYTTTGEPNVLTGGERPREEPKAGEVTIRILRSAVNPSDTKSRAGWGGAAMPSGLVIPHNDGSGVIDAVGEGVSSDRVGQRVWIYEATRDGRHLGTCAEYCTVPERFAVALPDNADLDTGACLGVPAMTAHRCLFADGPITNDTVLVTGGAGGVGHMAVMLAKWGGARVLATVSRTEQADVARRCGADVVIDYKREDVATRILDETNGTGVDRVIDVNFAANASLSVAVLKPNRTIATYASGQDASISAVIPFYDFLQRGLQIRFTYVYIMDAEAHANAVRDITSALNSGAISAEIAKHYTFDATAVAQAHTELDAGHLVGKGVIVVSES